MNKSEWQTETGEAWAEEWRCTDRSFGVLTERLLAKLRDRTFPQMLDIGCGAGELSLAIARARQTLKLSALMSLLRLSSGPPACLET